MNTDNINAAAPLITTFLAAGMVAVATFQPTLWREDGFIFVIGTLIGNGSTGLVSKGNNNNERP